MASALSNEFFFLFFFYHLYRISLLLLLLLILLLPLLHFYILLRTKTEKKKVYLVSKSLLHPLHMIGCHRSVTVSPPQLGIMAWFHKTVSPPQLGIMAWFHKTVTSFLVWSVKLCMVNSRKLGTYVNT